MYLSTATTATTATTVTTLTIEAPGHLLSTLVLADESAALEQLRQLWPEHAHAVADAELVHVLGEHGVRVQILRQDVSWLGSGLAGQVDQVGVAGQDASTFGDLLRYDTYAATFEARLGQFMRPATALEAAISRSCAALDGGLGVFGVRPVTGTGASAGYGPDAWADAQIEFLHFGSRPWRQALLTSRVRYYRVADIPASADLPALPATLVTVAVEDDGS